MKEYIHYHNNERIKVKLNGLSPVQHRTQTMSSRQLQQSVQYMGFTSPAGDSVQSPEVPTAELHELPDVERDEEAGLMVGD